MHFAIKKGVLLKRYLLFQVGFGFTGSSAKLGFQFFRKNSHDSNADDNYRVCVSGKTLVVILIIAKAIIIATMTSKYNNNHDTGY